MANTKPPLQVAVAAGPLGAGAGMDTGIMAGKRAPIFTYVVSRGLYAGIELTGQIFVEREEENEIVYQCVCFPLTSMLGLG